MPQYVSGECYVKISHKNIMVCEELPCYPDELQESTEASWSEQDIVGRSVPIAAYTGTGYRSISFSFTLHREMYEDDSTILSPHIDLKEHSTKIVSIDKIDRILTILRRSVYPIYISRGLTPPITTFRFGEFVAKGYVKSLGYNWKKPIINNKYQLCDISINMNSYADKVVSASDLKTFNNLNNPLNPFEQNI